MGRPDGPVRRWSAAGRGEWCGIIETAAPVSTRKRLLLIWSRMWTSNPAATALSHAGPPSFPASCRGRHTCEPCLCRTSGTGTGPIGSGVVRRSEGGGNTATAAALSRPATSVAVKTAATSATASPTGTGGDSCHRSRLRLRFHSCDSGVVVVLGVVGPNLISSDCLGTLSGVTAASKNSRRSKSRNTVPINQTVRRQ